MIPIRDREREERHFGLAGAQWLRVKVPLNLAYLFRGMWKLLRRVSK